MKTFAIAGLVATVGLAQVAPPLWPETFTQSFVQSYQNTHLHVTGRVHYDSKKDMERVDRSDGQHDLLCGSVLPNVAAPCTQLVRDKKRYIIHPQKNLCCMCCDQIHGCGVTKRDWLKDAKYEGQQTLSGQSFYKWGLTFETITDHYYATKTDQRIPRKLVDNGNKKSDDFIMNTYSIEPIPETTFRLPSYCTEPCKSTTICGKLRENNVQQQ